ncbi:MAG: hypothetical protein MZV70_56445 [Desulfobacterales bacterium]|nr:hypothetical protein [Desulfobacterales bacterium]
MKYETHHARADGLREGQRRDRRFRDRAGRATRERPVAWWGFPAGWIRAPRPP